MAKRALDAHGLKTALSVEESRDSDHSIEFEQCQRRSRVLQIDFSRLQLFHQRWRKHIHIDFQTYGQSGLGTYPGTDAPELLTFNGLVKFERVPPISFAAESVEAKSFSALVDHLL